MKKCFVISLLLPLLSLSCRYLPRESYTDEYEVVIDDDAYNNLQDGDTLIIREGRGQP